MTTDKFYEDVLEGDDSSEKYSLDDTGSEDQGELMEKISRIKEIKADLNNFDQDLLADRNEIPEIYLLADESDFENAPISDEKLELGAYEPLTDTIFIRADNDNLDQQKVRARHELTHRDNHRRFLGDTEEDPVELFKKARSILGKEVRDEIVFNGFGQYGLAHLVEQDEEGLRRLKADYMEGRIDDSEELVSEIYEIAEENQLKHISKGFDEAFAQFSSFYSASGLLEESDHPLTDPSILDDETTRKNAIDYMSNNGGTTYDEAIPVLETLLSIYDNLTQYGEMNRKEASKYIMSEVRERLSTTEI